MKTTTLKITTIAFLFALFSCSIDKQAQLGKLKDQQTEIAEKIKMLEDQLKSGNSGSLNPEEFKFVGVSDLKTSKFDHYIRVQGKLDGDQNAAVFAEALGTISFEVCRCWSESCKRPGACSD